MEKMFKRTLLGAAVATAAFATSVNAYEIGQNNDFSVEVYGVAAISAVNYDQETDGADKSTGVQFENESRIGFRAGKEMFENIEVFMQIESGYVDSWQKGELGARDTFIGLRGDWGKVRFGRMLTPMYEVIDWPYANPGLGASWDWGGDVKYNRDRHSNTVRYDSAAIGNLTYNVAAGRGDTSVDGNYWVGGGAHYRVADAVTFHAAFESESDRQVSASSAAGYDWVDADDDPSTVPTWGAVAAKDAVMTDTFGYLVGFEASLPAGFGISGAFKSGESDVQGGEKSTQDSFSLIGQYWNGPVGVKLGYTANQDSKTGSVTNDDDDSITSAQVMYVKNGFVPYVRVAKRDIKDKDGEHDIFVVRVGLEYGF
ncbi:porin [Aliivibrio kagoshimensis]|uniref:porin n=1 Tax=Aliivibrio kagoshimensis TaxID=2910230 RepID=UPI003D112DAC